MITLGDIFRQYGAAYRAQFGERLLPSQHAAMRSIEQCRTEALGGQVYSCPACGRIGYSYHSCRNRHCPTCQHDAAQCWLSGQQELLLPVPYFLVTFTLPAELRDVAYRHQRTLYNLLFRASAAALMELARDPRFLGAQIGLLGVLQTWTRDLRYHPHVHYLVPSGGLADDGRTWVTAKADFFVHVKPLAARVEGQAARRAATDRALGRDPDSRLAAALGGGLPASWHGTRRAQVSRALHLSGRALEQPDCATRR